MEQVRRYLQEERERLCPVLLSPECLEGWSHRSLKQQFLEAGNSRREEFPRNSASAESWKLALSKFLAQDRKTLGAGTSCKSALFMNEVGIWESGSLKYKWLFFFSEEQEHQA